MAGLSSARLPKPLLTLLVLALTYLVARRAWVSDDAFITMRTVGHFVNGDGLVWNPGFRVQTYTHPAWLFLVSAFYAVIRQPFVALVLPSVLLTAAVAAGILGHLSRTLTQATIAFAMLVSSRAFIDFSTSGLENPLVHVGLVLVVAGAFAEPASRTRVLGVATGLLGVTRHDSLLLVGPAFALLVFPELRDGATRRRGVRAIGLAATPLVLWTVFSIVYYGAPFPNTAYAKLFAHHGTSTLLASSMRYLHSHLAAEPFSLFAAAVPMLLAFVDRDPRIRAFAIGIALHLAYILSVGGDFMLGRFLTPAIVLGAALVARSDALERHATRYLPALVMIAAVAFSEWTQPSRPVLNAIDADGIADERDHWGPDMQLAAFRDGQAPRGPIVDEPRRLAHEAPQGLAIRTGHTAGFLGFYAGDHYYLTDFYGLTDGYVARLPAMREVQPRAGHNLRFLDDRFTRTMQTYLDRGELRCELGDRVGCDLLRDTLLAADGPLFDGARWRAIGRLNTGYYRDRLDEDRYRRPNLVRVDASSLESPKPDGTAWNAAGVVIFRDSGLAVRFPGGERAQGVVWSADRSDCLRMIFRSNRRELGSIEVLPIAGPGLLRRSRRLPRELVGRRFDEILVEPTCGDGRYSLGQLRVIRH